MGERQAQRSHRRPGVLEEAAGIAEHGRIGQLAAADRDHRVGDLQRIRLRNAPRLELAHEVGVAGDRLPPWADESAPSRSDSGPRLRLEDAVAIAEATVRGAHASQLTSGEIDGLERVEAFAHLEPVGADVLDRRGANGAESGRDSRVRAKPGAASSARSCQFSPPPASHYQASASS